jgi:hypothetical protein
MMLFSPWNGHRARALFCKESSVPPTLRVVLSDARDMMALDAKPVSLILASCAANARQTSSILTVTIVNSARCGSFYQRPHPT